jgi:hypothetical protein
MLAITPLSKFKVPIGGQEIELQQIDHVGGGMSLMRIRIREGKRFTIFDIDPDTAIELADAMQRWAATQTQTSGADQ